MFGSTFYLLLWFLLLQVLLSGSQKYVMFENEVNWYQALINCRGAGMELASVHSEEEQNELGNFLNKNRYDKIYWLSGTKEGNGNFYWATTGLKMIYTKWLIGQPDNHKYDTNFFEGEDCVGWETPISRVEPVGWNDITCFNNHSYICQTFQHCQ